jgi:hypothetical protein
LAIVILAIIGASFSKNGTKTAGAAANNITYYVSTNGLDTNAGTDKARPLRSVSKAFILAQQYTGSSTIRLVGTTFQLSNLDNAEMQLSGNRSVVIQSDTVKTTVNDSNIHKGFIGFAVGTGAGYTFAMKGLEFVGLRVQVTSASGMPIKYGLSTITVSDNVFSGGANLELSVHGVARATVANNTFNIEGGQFNDAGLSVTHAGWTLASGTGNAGRIDVRNNLFSYYGVNRRASGIYASSMAKAQISIYNNTFKQPAESPDTLKEFAAVEVEGNRSLIQIQGNSLYGSSTMVRAMHNSDPNSQILINGN